MRWDSSGHRHATGSRGATGQSGTSGPGRPSCAIGPNLSPAERLRTSPGSNPVGGFSAA